MSTQTGVVTLEEYDSTWELRYGKITRIYPKNGKPAPYKDKASGLPNPTLYCDIRVEEPGRRSEFIKCRVRESGLEVFKGSVYHGKLGHNVNVPRPGVGDYCLVEGYVKRDIPVIINKEQCLENRMYLTLATSISVDTNHPAYKAKQTSPPAV